MLLLTQSSSSGVRSRTLGAGVLAEVLGLVTAEDALSLDLGGRATGQFLVEVHNALHADSIGSSANGLFDSLASSISRTSVTSFGSIVSFPLIWPSSLSTRNAQSVDNIALIAVR